MARPAALLALAVFAPLAIYAAFNAWLALDRRHAALTAGTLYPLLHRLEAQKLVRSYWDESTGRKRKWYSLTAAGRKRLTSDARQLQTFAESMLRLLGGVLKKNPPEPA